ncbi:lysophospholipid acyltransferase family protein [Amycolatopsis sp. 195334CR]|uniref:lysophospholipid acyltransferase family protein n=1 Tax=Amycolatopsis sp. 195334CR TaxID=2814588 RepID=UPI001A8E65F6|nr:lysophospholipid acyltransferase family protein [Amycolatopsis sp. 195334CR]MBN6035997.1 1-acyl-sn-glycerol-3-phosphate acyltransferase [Amycolatopsis sp. 195334CR]
MIHSPCTPLCITDPLPPVDTAVFARRASALLSACAGGSLQDRSWRALRALDVEVDHSAYTPSEPGTLVVANHISWLDIPVLLALDSAVFLAKREVARWPFVGGLAKRSGALFIDRHSYRGLPRTVADLARTLRSGRSVVVFPEATTCCGVHSVPFRRAAFQAALDAGAPIQPVRISYWQGEVPSTVPAFVGDDTVLASVRRVLRARELSVRVSSSPVLEPLGDRRRLAALAQRPCLIS